MNWLVPKKNLSAQQEMLVELPIDSNRIITGAPGSGKTIVLVYRAKYFLDNLHVKKNRLHIFAYTNSLVNFISPGLSKIDIPVECISTFASWCLAFYKANIKKVYGKPDFSEITREVAEYLDGSKTKPIFDCVLVDEGQDLDENSFIVLRNIAKHITVCADEKQQIYDNGISVDEIADVLDIDMNTNRFILSNWRCTPYIAKLAVNFIEDEEERVYFLNQTMRDEDEGEVPYIAYSDDYELLNKKFRSVLKEKIADANINSIGIIVPQRKVAGGVANTLINNDIEVEYYDSLNFNSDMPKILPYHSAKGLTFDAVFLPSLDNYYFKSWNEKLVRRMIFVGISRAVKFVYMHFRSDYRLEVLNMLEELHEDGIIYLHNLDKNEDSVESVNDDGDDLYL